MKLKSLEIKHLEYYSEKPSTDRYKGKIEFFNEEGDAMTIALREDQLAGIVELCAGSIVSAAQENAQAIVTSMNPILQIEQGKKAK